MQRTAICLVAVLALLAGCSGGVGGGSDATQTPTPDASTVETRTQTPTPSPEPTPEPKPNDTSSGVSAPATTNIDRANANKSAVLEGDMLRFNATISNLNDTEANQTVTVRVGAKTVLNRAVEFEPRETQTVDLLTLNTSVIDPGGKFVTVSTANDSAVFRINIRPQDELEAFINDVRTQTRAFENGTILDRDHVLIRFDANEDLTKYYYSDAFDPVPQAAAFEMVTSEYAPEKVTVRILPFDAAEKPFPYQTTFNRSLATKLYNGTVDPKEFATILDERATGERPEVYEPEWLDRRGYTWAHERFTFFTGDRARWTYADEYAERMNQSGYDFLTVDDYGLYNGTVEAPNTEDELGPNAALNVTYQMENPNEELQYKGFNTSRRGVAIYETLSIYGNLTLDRTYGERPEFVRVRVTWPDGSVHTIANVPTYLARDGARSNTAVEKYLPIAFSNLMESRDTRISYD